MAQKMFYLFLVHFYNEISDCAKIADVPREFANEFHEQSQERELNVSGLEMKWRTSWKYAGKQHRKKSVDDLLNTSQDVINQAIALASPLKRTPSPAKSHKHDKSDVSIASTDNAEVENRRSSDGTSPSPEATSKSQDDLKDRRSAGSSKLAERAKKKAWYNVIYPSYKSRSEDFKKLFKDVPDDERLVVDYSCAIQKDILVHGRLYVSQNFICFHANIIVYETRFTLRWKDVTAISKEKVAKVIPNAILITTETDKYFLTSFASRDKAYMMLFRVWQNALMDKPMNPQEMWQWVHSCYGEQLGLTSDDEDYIDPTEGHELKNSADSVSEEPAEAKASSSSSSQLNTSDYKKTKKEKKLKATGSKHPQAAKELSVVPTVSIETPSPTEQLPTDMSDSSDSDNGNKMMDYVNDAECDSKHEGRQLVHTILPLNIETVFGLLFHKSKFFSEFHRMRKTTNLIQGEWETLPESVEQRVISLTVAITQVVGPKSSHVTETQVMRPCTKPGQLYSIDATSVNAGIPYADSFYVLLHYCMKRTVDDSTVMSVHAQIKYKKSVWGVVKGFIEKNTWLGLEEFYDSLSKALMAEYCIPPARAKSRRRRGTIGLATGQILSSTMPAAIAAKHQLAIDDGKPLAAITTVRQTIAHAAGGADAAMLSANQEKRSWIVIILLVALIGFNVILYVKLWKLDSYQIDTGFKWDTLRNPPSSPEEWLHLLQLQESLHAKEMKTWQMIIQSAIELLRKTEHSLSELQKQILAHRSKSSTELHQSISELFGDGP